MSFLNFMQEYGIFFYFGIQIIMAIILSIKTGNSKYIKEVYDQMKYRTESNFSTKKPEGQKFSNLKPVYRLNKATDTLEETGEFIDVQEIANSCKDVCMQSVLERFLPTETTMTAEAQAVDLMVEDLDVMQETITLANHYRSKFNLSADMSINDVFNFVKKQSEELKAKLNAKEKVNETKIIEESK